LRVLAFSDLHRSKSAALAIAEASRQADCVVGCGDFGTQGRGADDTLGILRDISIPLILVHGNHDNPNEIGRFCETSGRFYYLHGRSITINGVTFFGLGGEVPGRNTASWNSAETEAEAAKLLKTMPHDAVLATHTPPFGASDIQSDGSHEGSVAIRSAIETRAPKLSLCGHVHNAWGMSDKIGATRVHNLGPKLNWFDV
jgi:uncharacterized protein